MFPSGSTCSLDAKINSTLTFLKIPSNVSIFRGVRSLAAYSTVFLLAFSFCYQRWPSLVTSLSSEHSKMKGQNGRRGTTVVPLRIVPTEIRTPLRIVPGFSGTQPRESNRKKSPKGSKMKFQTYFLIVHRADPRV